MSTYLKKTSFFSLLLVVLSLSFAPVVAFAQSSNALSLSVTPTLFEMAAMPQQAWSSNVKVINNNPYTLTVYASVVNFAPQGETGQGKLIPVFEESSEGTTLAEWITITSDPIVIAPNTSEQVPFNVQVPDDAAPGGHFAAIMIGTRPPDAGEGFRIKTSQVVTSLFFVRIAGDVVEDGRVREFRTVKTFMQEPQVDFEVRFENQGNVHIQPQGEIVITNMWGKERGVIPINHKTNFGNVLPESIRKFEFTWKGELSFSDIGRYRAELTLAYGSDLRKFTTASTFFWVIPIKPLLTVLGVLFAIILFVVWAIKSYVRRMIALEGYEPVSTTRRQFKREGDVLIERRKRADAPVRAGWFDLKSRLAQTQAFVDTLKALFGFVIQYRLFFGAVVIVIVLIGLVYYFFVSVTEESRDYEVVIENQGSEMTLSSEQILYDRQEDAPQVSDEITSPIATSTQNFELTIVNSSNTTGAAAAMQRLLEPKFEVTELKSDFGPDKERSVIVYHPDLQQEALTLRSQVGDFLLSALPPDDQSREIIIYIGNDYEIPGN